MLIIVIMPASPVVTAGDKSCVFMLSVLCVCPSHVCVQSCFHDVCGMHWWIII